MGNEEAQLRIMTQGVKGPPVALLAHDRDICVRALRDRPPDRNRLRAKEASNYSVADERGAPPIRQLPQKVTIRGLGGIYLGIFPK
jgi:hypothetical protein